MTALDSVSSRRTARPEPDPRSSPAARDMPGPVEFRQQLGSGHQEDMVVLQMDVNQWIWRKSGPPSKRRRLLGGHQRRRGELAMLLGVRSLEVVAGLVTGSQQYPTSD